MPSVALSSTHARASLAALPAVWRADELARSAGATRPTGHAALDAQLPGGGWPVGALVELLQAQPGQGEWRLLLPALAAQPGSPAADAIPGGDALVLVGAPHPPFMPGLAAQGLRPSRLLQVQADAPAARVWAAEQALRCADVAAVLAWLPQVRPDALRRLQMAAQAHHKLLFVMRPLAAQHEASPAVLRLQLELLPDDDALALHILKRRGPPLAQPLRLAARAERLLALLAANRHQAGRRRAAADQLLRPSTDVAAGASLAGLARTPLTANPPVAA